MAEDPVKTVLEELDRVMNDYIDRVFQLSQEYLVDEDKIDSSHLFKTGNTNKKFLEKEVVYPAPYADVVEYGRLPGSPVDPKWLYKWVRRKLKITNEAEVKRRAFLIAKAIEHRGIAQSPYLRSSIEKANSEFGFELR